MTFLLRYCLARTGTFATGGDTSIWQEGGRPDGGDAGD
jgi:hypothetical protein